jgi:hypothetical protein
LIGYDPDFGSGYEAKDIWQIVFRWRTKAIVLFGGGVRLSEIAGRLGYRPGQRLSYRGAVISFAL